MTLMLWERSGYCFRVGTYLVISDAIVEDFQILIYCFEKAYNLQCIALLLLFLFCCKQNIK